MRNLLRISEAAWEAIDGPRQRSDCLMDHASCNTPGECHMRALSANLSREILAQLAEMKLSDIEFSPGADLHS